MPARMGTRGLARAQGSWCRHAVSSFVLPLKGGALESRPLLKHSTVGKGLENGRAGETE